MGTTVLPHIGFAIGDDGLGPGPVPVRESNAGNLVDAGVPGCPTGMWVFGRACERDRWPTIYDTADACWEAIHAAAARCAHDWRIVSHEERQCRRCGSSEFIPDID